MHQHQETSSRPQTADQAFDLKGRVALVTGGGTGLGLATARCLCASGASVALVGRREEPLRQAAESLGGRAAFYPHDITNVAGAPELAMRIAADLGAPVSILINNAGRHLKKPAIETTEVELVQIFDAHVTGAFALTRACLPWMLERGEGSVVFIASMASFLAMPLIVGYSTAKTAVLGMMRSLAAECAPHGVRVNAIAPGWIQSEMLDLALADDPQRKIKVLSRILLGELGRPEDVGWAATYLCSPAARYITGVCLPVDGGASVGF